MIESEENEHNLSYQYDAMLLQLNVASSWYLLSQNERNNIIIYFMQIIHTLSTELQKQFSLQQSFPLKELFGFN